MSTDLIVKIDRGMMPRGPKYNKPLIILVDDQALGEATWGDSKAFQIGMGKHRLTIKYKRFDVWASLDFEAIEGRVVEIESYMDRVKGGFVLFNRAAGTTSINNDGNPDPAYIQEIKQRQQKLLDQKVTTFFTTLGAALISLTAYFICGRMFGTFAAAIIGGVIGAIVGGLLGDVLALAVNGLSRKK